jgi:hypothetical protein
MIEKLKSSVLNTTSPHSKEFIDLLDEEDVPLLVVSPLPSPIKKPISLVSPMKEDEVVIRKKSKRNKIDKSFYLSNYQTGLLVMNRQFNQKRSLK